MENTIHLKSDMYSIGNNGSRIDFATLNMILQMEQVEMLNSSLQDQANEMKSKQDRYSHSNKLMAAARLAKSQAATLDPVTWSVEGNTIKLDGYEIEAEGSSRAWQIYELDENGARISGNTTSIWGDPHVNEGDGDLWDFSEGASFMLNDGTKITVGTTDSSNSLKYTDTLTITKGDQAVVVTGIGDNNVEISDVTLNGRELDFNTNDGHYVYEGDNVADWEDGQGQDIGKIDGSSSRYLYADEVATNETGELFNESAMSEEMKTFLAENIIKFFDSDDDGKLSATEWDNVIDGMKGLQDSLASTSQIEMIRLQQLMTKRNQSYEKMTNTMSKDDKTKDSLIGNLR